jgi:3-dehydroquinate synthase
MKSYVLSVFYTALDLMGHDKKVKHGQIRLILLKSIGDAVMTNEFDGQLLHEVLSKHSA